MQNQPSVIRFTLRALFICTAFVGLGLSALMYPFDWVLLIVNLVVVLLVTYAFIRVLACTGNRRLVGVCFMAASMLLIFNVYVPPFSHELTLRLCEVLHGEASIGTKEKQYFLPIARRLYLIVLSTAAAYFVPWIAQRGQKPPQA